MIAGWRGSAHELDLAREQYRVNWVNTAVRLSIQHGRQVRPALPQTFDEWWANQPSMSPQRQSEMRAHPRHRCLLCRTVVDGEQNKRDHGCAGIRMGVPRQWQVVE